MDTPRPPAEELLRKIQKLEAGQAELHKEMMRLSKLSSDRKSGEQHHHDHHYHHPPPLSRSISPQRRQGTERSFETGPDMEKKTSPPPVRHSSPLRRDSRRTNSGSGNRGGGGGRSAGPSAVKFSDEQYLNILQSMGQAVHVFDLSGNLIYWNRGAENLYGYSAAEALGRNLIELLVDPKDTTIAQDIVNRQLQGENWAGQFPVKTKIGGMITVVATNTFLYDDDGALSGLLCVSTDARPFHEVRIDFSSPVDTEAGSSSSNIGGDRACSSVTAKLGLDPSLPLQEALKSKISNLATKVSNKVKSKIRTGERNNLDDDRVGGSGNSHHSDANTADASTPRREDFQPSPFVVSPPGDEREGKPAIRKIITSKAEAWMGKKGLSWPWKGNEREVSEERASKFIWPWLQNDQEGEMNYPSCGSWTSSANVNSTSSVSSCGSTSSSTEKNRLDVETDSLHYDILWEDLTIGEQIGQGSCGTVCHALWCASDVAVKVFAKQEYSEDVILSFRQEVSLMKRLRHPNVLLFMGAVTSPQHLCIVTEFLPRGSLFQLLQRNATKLEWRRKVHMALDIARGMNYLHHFNPPIVHRDLKSSNLLVDRNWTVKVGDFGLSRLKHETFLVTKSGKGTPQWMAPEVLRNERSDEKSDIYSFGVILWELATEKIPWDNLNSTQIIGAVGFMSQRLEIPKHVDPRWASIMESCWLRYFIISHLESFFPFCRIRFHRITTWERNFVIQYSSYRIYPKSPAMNVSGFRAIVIY
ncbi:unnamed protein product [Linum tenue]|uniref:non-specific serine/threonine protein kinase n=1 Tax=Linum tenue TaxID=586396 RepID=A0AAV0RZF2_9ROSI|nr:unnamed protein product [Linum tenue]